MRSGPWPTSWPIHNDGGGDQIKDPWRPVNDCKVPMGDKYTAFATVSLKYLIPPRLKRPPYVVSERSVVLSDLSLRTTPRTFSVGYSSDQVTYRMTTL